MNTTYTGKAGKKQSYFKRLLQDMRRNYILYLMILPVVAYYIIFAYAPMYGIQLAFKNFMPKLGITGSPWVGLENFQRFFSGYNFWDILKNTVQISLYSLLVGFPLPIIFALFLNYVRFGKLKKTIQMVSYAPYFISMVVMCGMLVIFMTPETGVFNVVLKKLGFESIAFLSEPTMFKSIYVWSGVWQGMGWSSIIYISALSGVDYEMHEAAIIDGATKLKRIWHIDLPSIKSTIIILLILQIGQVMNVGFEKVYLLQFPMNMSHSEVISTYVYRMGLINNDYGYSTAVGLFNSVINVTLLVTVNQISKKFSKTSLW
ncbi:MAG: ABC transporter permease [Oscillospiraceae bacterium]